MKAENLDQSRIRGAALLRPQVTRAIWRAAIIEMARVGYDQMSMDAVARRAAVGKAALYRRWGSKEAMVVAMITAIDLEIVESQDHGSLIDDLSSYVDAASLLLRRPLSIRILPDLYAEMARDTDLAHAIRDTVYVRKQESVGQLLDRAVARGELSDQIDRNLAFQIIVGSLYWRLLVSRETIDSRESRRISAALAAAVVALGQEP